MADVEDFIITRSGKQFHFLDPDPDTILIEDIAHALSNTIRWGGHASSPMTVAQHSIVVSTLVGEAGGWAAVQLYALLHDASEAYLPDMLSPIKAYLPDFRELEGRVQSAILDKFRVWDPTGMYQEMTHLADIEAYRWEARDLLVAGGRGMIAPPTDDHPEIQVMPGPLAAAEFLWRFHGLVAQVEEAA